MPRISTDNYDTVASWNGSQDLFVVEQPDGTKVATPAQVKQYVLGDMDDVPTQNSNNPVKSGGIFSTMAVPKYDSANRREYYEGGAAFSGNIDSTPTAGSNNAVASGGTKTYVDNAVATKHNTDTVEFVGNVTMAANYLGTITASSLGISDCTKYNWDIRSKSWEAFPQIANVTTSSVTFYVRWLSSTSGGSVSLKNSGEVQITLTGMTRHNI